LSSQKVKLAIAGIGKDGWNNLGGIRIDPGPGGER
jgi:hypothetical protein